MTKVCCVREIINHDGKRKYLQEYGTNYTIGRLQLVYYDIKRACKKPSIPHIEYEITEEKLRNMGIMSKEFPKYLKWLIGYEHTEFIAIVKKSDQYAEYSKKILIRNGFIKFNTSINDNFETYLFSAKFGSMLKTLQMTEEWRKEKEFFDKLT